MIAADKELLRATLKSCGAAAVGFAPADCEPEEYSNLRKQWIDSGYNAGMDYMARNEELRQDPRMLLEGTKTIISLAFPYRLQERPAEVDSGIASYALLYDYHDRIRSRIRQAGIERWLGEEHIDWRICVDSAPMAERYRAREAGIGYIGRNGMLIVPEAGSEVFLAEIITTTEIEPDTPASGDCGNCGACLKACPAGALHPDGTIDCNRCISYLTIEHRGPWVNDVHKSVMQSAEGIKSIYGCDRCVAACPHNRLNATEIFTDEPIHPGVASLTREKIREISEPEFNKLMKGSAMKRAKLQGLLRNIDASDK
ncbi:MAG: tRNA epoxyqueuosine(34) reductase QueG [Muribaculaceae bacterium]|nr:tRNA epoxyqueuosine(34) reductase QueG [Muribaculaceae bacterium]